MNVVENGLKWMKISKLLKAFLIAHHFQRSIMHISLKKKRMHLNFEKLYSVHLIYFESVL